MDSKEFKQLPAMTMRSIVPRIVCVEMEKLATLCIVFMIPRSLLLAPTVTSNAPGVLVFCGDRFLRCQLEHSMATVLHMSE
jgi:hypothetical protein